MNTFRHFLLFSLASFAFACGGSTESTSSTSSTASTPADSPTSSTAPSWSSYSTLAPATGDVTVAGHSTRPITGFVFTNDGSSDIVISNVVVTLADGSVRDDSPTGFGVAKGTPITYLFDKTTAHDVTSLSFSIEGSTESLVITQTTETTLLAPYNPGTPKN